MASFVYFLFDCLVAACSAANLFGGAPKPIKYYSSRMVGTSGYSKCPICQGLDFLRAQFETDFEGCAGVAVRDGWQSVIGKLQLFILPVAYVS